MRKSVVSRSFFLSFLFSLRCVPKCSFFFTLISLLPLNPKILKILSSDVNGNYTVFYVGVFAGHFNSLGGENNTKLYLPVSAQ